MLNHEDFITKYTKLQYLSFVPEIRLFLNKESIIHDMLKQELGNDTPRPYWTQQWAGGLALSRYIIDNPDIVKDKHVVDFCSGSGIVGIAAALVGAASVTCVDNDPVALSSSMLNARANKVSIKVSGTLVPGDIVLAGDPSNQTFIFDILRETECYIGCPVRNENNLKGFDIVCSYNITNEEFLDGVNTYIINKTRNR
jgi:predicted nicotinamide N-methyase